MKLTNKFKTLLAVSIIAMLGGCSSMKPGAMSAVQTHSDRPRVGNVYLLRGFIGIFSTGIDSLGQKINHAQVRANVYQDDQWRRLANEIELRYRNRPDAEPIVLIGHSYGADDVVRIARRLNDAKVPVDLLITLDPVTPPGIPPNVRRAVNIYQSNGALDKLPWLRGVAVKTDPGFKGELVCSDIRTDRRDLLTSNVDHFNIEKQEPIHNEVIKQVLAVCIPRSVWVQQRNAERLALTGGGAAPSGTTATGAGSASAFGTDGR
jgi:pimeloyl-ACP methyl ester carboxylesterase